MSKKVWLACIIPIVYMVVVFLLFAFIVWDINPNNWGSLVRFGAVLFASVPAGCIILFILTPEN